ncbi:hypothetical protein [Psittacicella gerlachiana]|uniref:Uncharacterized protein n=1 Tax=Psittacicella gerlachiana TaxID=2028574 RepID=A0A3A1YHE1_9GAMM|nr:hypothetical protein [Psittacicella gerlachiana]RIY37105.1 hypothetical protein CKF59_02040 [Psittacicella gerlachiana]
MSTQNLFGVTFELMVNSALINLLKNNSTKLPTKTFIAQQLNSTPKKLGLSNISVEDLILKSLNNYEFEINSILENILKDRKNDSLEEKVTVFTKEIIKTLLSKPQLAHILSFNNLYANLEFSSSVTSINLTTYFAYKRLFNRFNEKISNTFSKLFNDLLSGIYLNISQNISHGVSQSILQDLEEEINNEITLLKNLVKKISI